MKKRRKTGVVISCIIVALAIVFGLQCLKENNLTLVMEPDAEAALEMYAFKNGFSMEAYPQSMISLYERNPEARDFVLNYPLMHNMQSDADMREYIGCEQVPLFLQWDKRWGYMEYGNDVVGITGCGPVSLSMAAWYVTGNDAMSPDRIVTFALENGYCVPGNGSKWTLISEGGRKLGLDVTEIPLVKDRIFANLEVDNPIICVMGPGDFTTTGHFIVMAGCQDGKIVINDPNSVSNSQKLWRYEDICDQIRNLWVIRAGT